MCLALNEYWQQHGQTILNFGLVATPYSSGIGSNTYRIIIRNDGAPRGFVKDSLNNWSLSARNLLIKPTDTYCQLHQNLITHFENFLHVNHTLDNLSPLGIERVYSGYFKRKVVDLFIKQQAWHGHFAQNCDDVTILRDWLLQNAYQPIDSKTLKYFRIQNIPNFDGGNIPANVGMSYVNNHIQYLYFQEKISIICQNNAINDIPVPRFSFDYYVWNYWGLLN